MSDSILDYLKSANIAPTTHKLHNFKTVEHLSDDQVADLTKFGQKLSSMDEQALAAMNAKGPKPTISLFQFLGEFADYLRSPAAMERYGAESTVQTIEGGSVEVVFPPKLIQDEDGKLSKVDRSVSVPIAIFEREVLRDNCDYADLADAMYEYI